MSNKPTHRPATSRWWLALLAGWLASGGPARAQQPGPPGQAELAGLARPVAPTPGNHSLGEVLAELSRQSGLPFSYSSSLIPVGHRYQLPAGPARPLGVVLRDVLADTHLSYGLLDGQLVLWPAQAALPAGVTAVNGQPTRKSLPLPGRAVATAVGASPAASTGTSASPLLAPNTGVAAPLTGRHGPAAGLLVATSVSRQRGSNTLGASASTVAARLRPHWPLAAQLANPASAKLTDHHFTTQTSGQVATATERAARLPSAGTTLPGRARSAVNRLNATGTKGTYLAKSASPGGGRSLAFLSPRVSILSDNNLSSNGLPAVHALSSRSFTTVTPAHEAASPPAAPGKRLNLATIWSHTYLHGEAWLSESLPVGGTAKIGAQRLYLVLNAAIGPLDRRSGVAWGLGLGTAGQAWGRFTPSVDLMAWALPKDGDDDDIRHARLVQLRPLLAWQLRRDGQVSLLLGPTLNLATATQTSLRRWSFGQNQPLWLNQTDDQAVLRLWPGVQVGVRF